MINRVYIRDRVNLYLLLSEREMAFLLFPFSCCIVSIITSTIYTIYIGNHLEFHFLLFLLFFSKKIIKKSDGDEGAADFFYLLSSRRRRRRRREKKDHDIFVYL